jgi:cell division transport system permease protein
MRQLRILKQVLIETGTGIKRSGWSNWLVLSILAIALTIFGGVLQLTMTLKNVVTAWGTQVEVSAYLKDGCDSRQVANKVSQMPNVKLVEIIPKEVAWEEMQSSFKVASLSNPLPNTLHIRLTSPDAVEATAARIKLLDSVEHVRYPLKVAQNINKFRHFIEAAGIVLTAALTAATLVVIGNTIHLVIQARTREIEILSLMGVSPWYIKGPLVFQGAFYGLGAAFVAIVVLWATHSYIGSYIQDQFVGFLPLLPGNVTYGMLPTFLVLSALGIAVGAGGSAWTSGRYIKS